MPATPVVAGRSIFRGDGSPLTVRTRLLAGEDVAPIDRRATRLAAQAVQGLARPLHVDPAPFRLLLSQCLDFAMAGDDQFARSVVRRAIARLDELTSPW